MSLRSPGARLVPWLLPVLVAVLFAPTVTYDLLKWDDWVNVTGNPYLRPPRLERLRELWSGPYEGLYIPLTYTLYSAEAALGDRAGAPGPDPRIFHAGNVALHAACVLLVYLLLRKLGSPVLASATGAALLAVHPLTVESVAWVSEAKGLLAACFVVIGLLFHAGPAGARTYALTGTAFLLSLLAKPTAVAFPLLCLVMDVGILRRSAAWSLRRVVPLAGVAIVFAVITKRLQPDTRLLDVAPVMWRPVIALDAIGFTLSKIVLPVGLAFDHGRSPTRVLDGAWWAFALPTLVLLALAVRWPRKPPSVALAWIVAALLPVAGLVPFAFQYASTVAERYTYLALIGPAYLVCSWVASHQGKRTAVAAIVLLLALAARTTGQIRHWRSDEDLFTHALRVNPASFNALDGLGMLRHEEGRAQEALGFLEEAVGARPDDARARLHRAGVLRDLGRLEEAEAELAVAETLRPGDPAVELALGRLAHTRGDLAAAEDHYRTAIAARSDMTSARYALATCLWAQGNVAAAEAEYAAILRIMPDHFQAHVDLGKLGMNAGDGAGAIAHWRKALAVRPDDAEVRAYLRAAEQGGSSPR